MADNNATLKHAGILPVILASTPSGVMREEDKTYGDIFLLLCENLKLASEALFLYSGDGELITSTYMTSKGISPETHTFEKGDAQFYIVYEVNSYRITDIIKLGESFRRMVSILYDRNSGNQLIFDGFDALPNEICIYDKDFRFAYANSGFFDYVHVKNPDKAIGRKVEDVFSENDVKITAAGKSYNHFKARDVIKYGKPIIGWEVEVSRVSNPHDITFASNDMYPVHNESGEVVGVVEISRSRSKQLKQLSNDLGLIAEYDFDDILGSSPSLTKAKQTAMSFALSPYSVLIYGESGVGKELFAQAIHSHSVRRNNPFVAINCASIPTELMDSELFGYDSGSFTGASKKGHIGKFELASGGTLFLDEIAELPMSSQASLLRTLETHQITKIGGTRNIPVDVRIIAATNRSLEKMVEEGLFRGDLYYRLMVLNLTIPPVREHAEDIPIYADYFLSLASFNNNMSGKSLSEGAKRLMQEYNWPGNIREIRNVMNRVSVLSDSDVISRELLYSSLQSNGASFTSSSDGKSPEERLQDKKAAINRSYADLINEALSIAGSNKTKAAELLGVSRKTFYNMMERNKKYFE